MNVGGKLTFIVSVDKGGLEKCTLSEILHWRPGEGYIYFSNRKAINEINTIL